MHTHLWPISVKPALRPREIGGRNASRGCFTSHKIPRQCKSSAKKHSSSTKIKLANFCQWTLYNTYEIVCASIALKHGTFRQRKKNSGITAQKVLKWDFWLEGQCVQDWLVFNWHATAAQFCAQDFENYSEREIRGQRQGSYLEGRLLIASLQC